MICKSISRENRAPTGSGREIGRLCGWTLMAWDNHRVHDIEIVAFASISNLTRWGFGSFMMTLRIMLGVGSYLKGISSFHTADIQIVNFPSVIG